MWCDTDQNLAVKCDLRSVNPGVKCVRCTACVYCLPCGCSIRWVQRGEMCGVSYIR